ncbi:histone chaperone ASF1 [Nematocida sp. AWRm77]|nr:histone chaperone ASF1 [Nematocida sp. AWRm77]
MIEVCNIDFLTTDNTKSILKGEMCFRFQIRSESADQKMTVKVIYMGTSVREDYDQVLCNEKIESIPKGIVEFDLPCELPDLTKVPKEYLLGLTSIVIVCYTEKEHEFARIGYLVKIEYPGVMIKETEATADETAEKDKDNEEEEDENEENEDEQDDDFLEKDIDVKDESEEKEKEEEAEEEAEEEMPLPIPEGTVVVTPEEFSKMDIDFQKIEAELLEPPLITVFGNAWTTLDNEPESQEHIEL